MQIEEAIIHAREVSDGCPAGDRQCAYQHDQLADWLEELKSYKATGLTPEEVKRLKELSEADAKGLLLMAAMPIGTRIYRLHKGTSEDVRIIDGEEYTRKVPKWYVTHHDYSWINAVVDSEHPELKDEPHNRYYLSLEAAIAERDRINAGGDPYATGDSGQGMKKGGKQWSG